MPLSLLFWCTAGRHSLLAKTIQLAIRSAFPQESVHIKTVNIGLSCVFQKHPNVALCLLDAQALGAQHTANTY